MKRLLPVVLLATSLSAFAETDFAVLAETMEDVANRSEITEMLLQKCKRKLVMYGLTTESASACDVSHQLFKQINDTDLPWIGQLTDDEKRWLVDNKRETVRRYMSNKVLIQNHMDFLIKYIEELPGIKD